MKQTIINIFGGPSYGKTATATGLFSYLKRRHVECEYVSEYAKNATYEERMNILTEDQLYVLAKQQRNMRRIKDVPLLITDSPLIIGRCYFNRDFNFIDYDTYVHLVNELRSNYNEVNFLIEKPSHIPYQISGRYQNEEESNIIHNNIRDLLIKDDIKFDVITLNENIIPQMVTILMNKGIIS